ncbi:MAG: nucleotidyl transferase AbiEii/AbiGii toxin family protein [Clostridia bacterium]|nr:nucleotidyl transferase AbiEii/AbiGii toxin family protein [Clostridia bacterium]
MNLHKNPQEFYDTLLVLGDRLNTSPAIIEKDYYVTIFLEALAKRVPNLLFKGGTSLSKCHKIINRFSEDIDLTLDAENQTQGNKRNLKYEIVEVCNELGLELINEADIRSRRDYNRYEIKYPIHFEGAGIKQYLLVETVFMVKSYPDEIKKATSMIYDFWKEIGDETAIEEYEMKPFEIRVQTLDRTLVDKVFALCDYAVSNNTTGYSRHIYDLYRLLSVVVLDDKLKALVKEVREDRKTHERCYTAQDQYDIPSILKQIIDKRIYYKDYENITKKVLFDGTSYETSITALYKIIKSGVFSK